jgi:hypothetical protein
MFVTGSLTFVIKLFAALIALLAELGSIAGSPGLQTES